MFTLMRLTACRSLWVAGALLIGATPGRAINITIYYAQEDPSPFESNNETGATLVALFEAAALYWENYLPNMGNYNVGVSWDADLSDDPADNVLGSADSVSVDIDLLANPLNMDPAAGDVLDVPAPWFIDPTPFDHSEFDLARIEASSLSQGEINAYFNGSSLPPSLEIGYRGPAKGGSDADGRYDALTVALHELGHILGVNDASGDSWIPSPSMTGGQLVEIDNTEEDDAHIAAPTALMFPFPGSGSARTLPSTIDILAVVIDEDFTIADVPRKAFLVAQPNAGDPDFSWHVGPFFWEGGSQPGTDDQARITNGARVALQTADVQIASLVVAGESLLKTQNRALLVDGLTEIADTDSEMLVGAGGSLETTDLTVAGGTLNLNGGSARVNRNVNVTSPDGQLGLITGFGTLLVTERLTNDGHLQTRGGNLSLSTSSPNSVEVWDLDGAGGGSVAAVSGNIIVQGSHHGSFDGLMTIERGRLIQFDRPWAMGEEGNLVLNGVVGAPATLYVDVAEMAGQVNASIGKLDGKEYVFTDTAKLVVTHPLFVLELATLSRFRGVEFFGLGTVRQLSDIVVESPTTIENVIFDWGNTTTGTDVNELIVQPGALLTTLSESTGTADNEYRGTIRLNNGVMDVQRLPGWTLPTYVGDADGPLGVLVLHNNPELPTPPALHGSDLTVGGVIRSEGGFGAITADLIVQSTAEIEVQAAAALALNGNVTYDGPEVHGGGTLHQSGNAAVVSPTTVSTMIYDWDGRSLTPSTMTIGTGASLTINSDQIDVGPPADDGYGGHVTVEDSAALVVNTNGPWRLDGTMTLEGQPVTTPNVIADGSDLVNHGTIEGNGRIQSSLENHGTLRPGASAGVLRFAAGFTLTSDGVVDIEIGGPTPLTEYDRIIVNQFGTASLAGDLAVSLINGFLPDADASFTILTAGLVSGMFDHELKGGLPPGLTYKVEYNSNSVVLSFLAGYTADFNMDGVVDGDDLAQWQSSFGVDAGGDADGDGITDGADFLILQQQLGGSLPAVAAQAGVPEPAAWSMFCLGTALFVGGHRASQRGG